MGPHDMDLPGFRLHPLKGDLAGFWAVTVRANRRIMFRFEGGQAPDVNDHQRGHTDAHARPAPSRRVHPPPVP